MRSDCIVYTFQPTESNASRPAFPWYRGSIPSPNERRPMQSERYRENTAYKT